MIFGNIKKLPNYLKELAVQEQALKKVSIAQQTLEGLDTYQRAGNITAYQAAIKGLSAEQAVLALSTKGLNETQIEEILTTETATLAKGTYTQADVKAALAKNGLAAASTILTAEQQKEIVNSGLLTSEKLNEIATTLGLETAEGGELVSKKALNAEMVKQQLESIGVVGATQQQILVMLGLAKSEGIAITFTEMLSAAFKKLWITMLGHPLTSILLAITAVAAGTVAIIDYFDKTSESTRKLKNKYKKINETFEENEKKLENINSELEQNKNNIDEIKSKGKLSYIDLEEIERLKQTNELLEKNKKILEEQQKLAGEDYVEAFTQKQDKYYYTNEGKDADADKISYVHWIKKTKAYAEANGWTDFERVNYAKEFLENNPDASEEDIDKFIKILRDRYLELSEFIENITKNYPELLDDPDVKRYIGEMDILYDYINNYSWNTKTNKKELKDKYGTYTPMAAGVMSEVINRSSKEQAEIASNWIDSLTAEELEFANSQKFDEALKIYKMNKSNGKNLTTEDYETVLQNIMYQEEIIQATYESIRAKYDKELQKAIDWGLEEYLPNIKNGTLQSKYGNVNMDKRFQLDWNEDYLEEYKEALKTYPGEIDKAGNIISNRYEELKKTIEEGRTETDTVFGGLYETTLNNGDESINLPVAYTPMMVDDNGNLVDFLSKDNVENYINSISQQAIDTLASTGEDWTSEDLYKKIIEIDAEGSGYEVGGNIVKGIISGVGDYTGEGGKRINAEIVSMLTHFSGVYGAINPLLEQLKPYWDEFDLSDEEKEKYDKTIEKFNSLSEAIRLFESGQLTASKKIELFKEFPSLSNETDDLGEAIRKLADDEFEKLYDAMVESRAPQEFLDTLRQLYKSTMDEVEAIKELYDSTNISHLNIMQNSQKGWDILNSIYDDILDAKDGTASGKKFDWSSILNNEEFNSAFKNLDGYNEFITTITANTGNIEACREAFNKLATSYIWHDKQLNSVTEDTRAATIAYYEQLGVINAVELVDSVLAIRESYVTKAKEKGIDASKGLENATYKEIDALIGEDEVLDETTKKIVDFWMEKNNANDLTLATDGDITALTNLVEATGLACDGLNRLARVKANLNISLKTLEDYYNSGEISEQVYKDTVESITDFADGKTLKDDNTGQTYSLGDMDYYKQAQKEIEDFRNKLNIPANINKDVKVNFDSSINNDDDNNSDKDSDKTVDWVEKKIAAIERVIDELNSTIDNTYENWSKRNKAISDEIGMLRQEYDLQGQAYQTYMNYANSLGLDQGNINLIQNGAMRIELIEDDKTRELISEYETWFDKANEALVKQREIERQINDSIQNRLNNIKSIYEYTISTIEHSQNLIQNKLDALDAKGLFANGDYYNQLVSSYLNQKSQLEKERAELVSQLNQTSWDKDSEAYQNLISDINSIDEKMAELNVTIIETNNNLRNLGWEVFEYLEEALSKFTSEAEYLIDLISNEDLYNKDNGNFTKYATATVALRASNYDIYKQQAKDYEEELVSLRKQLKAGAGKEVLEQYNKMVQAHQEAVKSANEERKAILDLIEEGYNAQLEALQKVIDKRKEELNLQKDAYDYQKNIAEKADKVSTLEKQMSAFAGDDSEDTMARIQQLQVELDDARKDLEETEYDRYLSDTENMLDTLASDYEEWMNARLDQEDALLSEIISSVETKGTEIKQTLQEVATENGTFISAEMLRIFDSKSPFSNMLTSNMSNIASIVNQSAGTLSQINAYLSKIALVVGAEKIKTNAGSNNKPTSSGSIPSGNNKPNSNSANSNTSSTSSKNNTNQNNSKWGSWFVSKKSNDNKNSLNINTSIVDRLKYFDIDPSMEQRARYYAAMGGTGTYSGTAAQNIWMLSQMKAHGYKTGTHAVPKSGNYWTQENGQEIIIRKSDGAILTPLSSGDMVFNNEASKRLWELSQNPEKYLSNMSMPQLNIGVPNYSGISSKGNVSQIMDVKIEGINIELPGVTDYESFRSELIKDSTFEKAMSTMVNNIVMKKNPLGKMKYARV